MQNLQTAQQEKVVKSGDTFNGFAKACAIIALAAVQQLYG